MENTIHSLKTVIKAQLQALLNRACFSASVSEQANHVFDLLTAGAMDRPAVAPFAGLAHVNANGLPFQWSFCLGEESPSVRFLCEAGIPGDSAQSRLAFSVGQLKEAFRFLNVPDPGWLWDIVFPTIVPKKEEWPAQWGSAFWTGVGISAHGMMIKPYFNLKRGTPLERWTRIGWLLKHLGKEKALARLCDLSSRASQDSWPVGLAVDVRPDGKPGRIKIYFESSSVKTDWLQGWYYAAGAEAEYEPVRSFLDSFPFCGSAHYPEKAFIVSVEFHKEDGEISLKTDLGINRWITADQNIEQGIRRFLSSLEIDSNEFITLQKTLGAWPPDKTQTKYLRFVSYGYEPGGERHLNIYMEPPLKMPDAIPSFLDKPIPVCLEESIKYGVEYILSRKADGRWKDYLLPVGESDQWVTAYILWKLSSLPAELIREYKFVLRDALSFLCKEGTKRSGWGYNESTDPDSDSTSIAILALRGFGQEISNESIDFIKKCQSADGGTVTYLPGKEPGAAWNESVTDITSVAFMAYGTDLSATNRAAAIEFLTKSQVADGLWPSYWWISKLYPTLQAITVLSDNGGFANTAMLKSTLDNYNPSGAFETALLIQCFMGIGMNEQAEYYATKLIESQLQDGSWEPSAFLRLTNPEVREPWRTIDSGTMFVDHNALFTTATVLSALAAIHKVTAEMAGALPAAC